MGHSQTKCEVHIDQFNRGTWMHIERITAAQLNHQQTMTYNQRFLERQEIEYGAFSDYAMRKMEHEA